MSKSKPEALLGLSMNDARLILLANYIAGDPKVRTLPLPRYTSKKGWLLTENKTIRSTTRD